jgi:TRAP-type C4-dicarboxylate transport system permease small subunit
LPIWGLFEVGGFLGALVISFSLIHPTLYDEHLSVELVVSRLPKKAQVILALFKRLAGLCVFGLTAWQSARYGFRIWETGQVSGTLKMPLHPILWGIASAFGISALILVLDLISKAFRVKGEDK